MCKVIAFKKKPKQEQKSVPTERDPLQEAMQRNAANEERLKRERTKHNKSVKKGYRL